MDRYGHSQLANILYGAQLAQQYPDLSVISVHFSSHSNRSCKRSCDSEQNARPSRLYRQDENPPRRLFKYSLWAATVDDSSLKSGAFYEPVAVPGKHSNLLQDSELAQARWDETQQQLDRQ